MPRVKLFDEQEALKNAMLLFWKKGYYATSIQDLVNDMKVNRCSMYDTFEGKKKLFERAYKHYCDVCIKRQYEFLYQHKDVRVGLTKLFQSAINESLVDIENKGCFAVNSTVELIPNEDNFRVLVENNKESFEKMFLDYLKYGVETNQISNKKDLKVISSLLFTFYNGLKVITKVSFNKDNYLKSVDTLLSILDD